MSTFRVDSSRFERRLRKLRADTPRAREETLRQMVRQVAAVIAGNWPRDTNRSARGWIMAFNDLGLGPFPVPPVVESKYQARNEARLFNQLRKWELAVKRYERQGRFDKWYRKAVRKRDKASEQVERYLASQGTAVVIGGRSASALATIRDKVYGGEGRILETERGLVLAAVNKEPHTKIVESNTRIIARTSAAVWKFGGRRFFKSQLRKMDARARAA